MRSPNRRLPSLVSLVAATVLLAPPSAAGAGEGWKPELLPRDEEVAAALEAAPPGLREQAGVYVLTAAGYDLVRASRNGFHCLLERSHPSAFEPQCFDAEGSETILASHLLDAKLRMGGAGEEEVRRAVADAWMRGELRAPRRPGINYMLSPRNRVPVDEEGTIIPYRPHVMFYAPYLTNADVGGAPGGASPVFVINEGRPGAYIIVPVPPGP